MDTKVKGLVDSVRINILSFGGKDTLTALAEEGVTLLGQNKIAAELEKQATGIGSVLLGFAKTTGTDAKNIADKVQAFKGKLAEKQEWLGQLDTKNLSKENMDMVNILSGKNVSLENLSPAAQDFINESKALLGEAQKYSQGAQALVGIAGELRIKLPENIQKGVALASNAVNIGMSLMSSTINPLAAISAVSGLVGMFGKKKKKGPDVGTQRHTQIMKAFGRLAEGQNTILRGQKVIVGKLDNLAKGQQALFDGQQALHETLNRGFTHLDGKLEKIHEAISNGIEGLADGQKQIMQNQQKLFEFLSGIDSKISEVLDRQIVIAESIQSLSNQLEKSRIIIMEALQQQTQRIILIGMQLQHHRSEKTYRCMGLVNKLKVDENYDAEKNRFLTYSDLSKFHGLFYPLFKEGLKSLYKDLCCLGVEKIDSKLFALDKPQDVIQPEASPVQIFTNYQTQWAFVSKNLKQAGISAAVASAINPTKKIRDLQKKQELQIPTQENPLAPFKKSEVYFQASLTELLSSLYSYETVRDYATFAFRLHYFFDLVDEDYKLKNSEELKYISGGKGKLVLKSTLSLLNVAIAQQTLYSGNASLTVFYDVLTKPTSKKEEKEVAYSILSKNPLLAENFVLYLFNKISQEKDPHLANYITGISDSESSAFLNTLLPGNHWIFEQIDSNWHLKFGERHVKLPSAKSVALGELQIQPGVEELVKLRKKLVEELMGYEFLGSSSGKRYAKQIIRGLIKA